MTVEKLIKKLKTYADQGIEQITDDEGRNIHSVCNLKESKRYVVLNTSYDEAGSLTVMELISELEKCDNKRWAITQTASEFIDAVYECLIEPTVVLLKSINAWGGERN